jgi:hypothetical protein
VITVIIAVGVSLAVALNLRNNGKAVTLDNGEKILKGKGIENATSAAPGATSTGLLAGIFGDATESETISGAENSTRTTTRSQTDVDKKSTKTSDAPVASQTDVDSSLERRGHLTD